MMESMLDSYRLGQEAAVTVLSHHTSPSTPLQVVTGGVARKVELRVGQQGFLLCETKHLMASGAFEAERRKEGAMVEESVTRADLKGSLSRVGQCSVPRCLT